ncbi:homoaconitase [Melioribacter roseus P3M-2]|uniref:Aconitate hydratase A n=1 Tax=Melioribacter roseus (strain DSM 23840 / JCM 17771 / VKM B-2668 / P3M-2) TaxID=1191523 RepID=I6Z8G8_MELRP|nr:homoaconitase [Melioribacter roseus]AFN75450.1 homoaconitase [Melioribacter roseus P3M-2]
MPQTLVEKIAQKHAIGLKPNQEISAGDYITIRPAYVMTHDNTGAVIPKFKSIGATKLANPRQVVITLDHDIQNKDEKNLNKYKRIEEFAKEMGADFYPAGRGIGHQIMVEEGYAFPGSMVVASDSHSNMYGGIGCLGTPIVRTDAASIWATGKTWWQVPQTVKVVLTGSLSEGVTGKDVIIALCGYFNNDEVLNCAVEFSGDGINCLSVDQRLSIANMTTEWGAVAGLFPVDDITLEWIERRIDYIEKRGPEGVPSDADGNGKNPRLNRERLNELKENLNNLKPDTDAFYAKELTIDLSSIEPVVSGPNSVKKYALVSELTKKKVKIDKAYLVSCVNSRLEDIEQAAKIVKGKKIAPHVKFYIAAASSEVQKESEARGYWQDLIEAGAIPLPPGCGPCIGLGAGLLEDGEVGISATNRNFKGRMGSPNAFAYLASPAVVAYSAVSGYINYDISENKNSIAGSIKINSKSETQTRQVDIIEGFPTEIKGEIIFCPQDNLNTDGIYPGKYTYNDDMTPQDQANVVMENYDPEFRNIAQEGDILVGGFNFGTGSSREQAATALKYKGIQLVIAGSFSETYKRNAINNGFLAIECPQLVTDLKKMFGSSKKNTIKTEIVATVDFVNSKLIADDKIYTISPVGIPAQELIVPGGLENWIKKNLGN